MHIPWNNTVNTLMHLFCLNLKNCQTQTLGCTMGIQMLDCDTSGNIWVHDQLPQQVISFLLQNFQAQSTRGTQYFKKHKISLLSSEVTKFQTMQILRLVKNMPVFHSACQVKEQNLLFLRTSIASSVSVTNTALSYQYSLQCCIKSLSAQISP